jgi:hypothetical protein
MRLVTGKHSSFLGCTHPELPKYLPQPVRQCGKFEAKA